MSELLWSRVAREWPGWVDRLLSRPERWFWQCDSCRVESQRVPSFRSAWAALTEHLDAVHGRFSMADLRLRTDRHQVERYLRLPW